MKFNKKLIYDCLIIGGGPAGLLAATYLARYRRHIAVIDNGRSRAALIPTSHNYPGTQKGISGKKILENLRKQLQVHGIEPFTDTITHLKKDEKNNLFLATSKNCIFRSKKILLATGVSNIEPDLPNLKEAILNGFIRHCMICDGYEIIDKRVALIGYGKKVLEESLFLKTYTQDITILTTGRPIYLSRQDVSLLENQQIKIITDSISDLIIKKNKITAFRLKSGTACNFDTIYSALGTIAHSDFTKALDIKLGKNHCILTDKSQQTSASGVYAAGDITTALDQISVAFGQAAIAATAIHNILRE